MLPAEATVADGLPAFGIVAAVMGVVVTMGYSSRLQVLGGGRSGKVGTFDELRCLYAPKTLPMRRPLTSSASRPALLQRSKDTDLANMAEKRSHPWFVRA